MDDQLQANIYATKCKRPQSKPNRSNKPFPCIEREVFEALSEPVREKIQQHHANYQVLLRQACKLSPKISNSPQRSLHMTTLGHEEMFEQCGD